MNRIRMFRRNSAILISLIVFALLMLAQAVYASQEVSDEARQVLMDEEMDCIAKNFHDGAVSWQETCASQYSSRSSSRYDVARSDEIKTGRDHAASSQYAPANDHNANIATDYKYSDYAYTDKSFNDSLDLKYSNKEDADSGRFFSADIRLLGGYRKDDFDWNIANDITGVSTPNILSELTWSDLKMTQIKAEGDMIWWDRFVIDGMISSADIYEGDNQDSDYDGDDRTLEWSRSNNKSRDGQAFDWSSALGYRVPVGPDNDFLAAEDVILTALAGYSRHELDLIITDGFQSIPATGPFSSLHSSYWAEWDGPWAGFKLEGKKNRIFGAFRFEYHWADYYGSANWNLRSDFQHPKSFEHTADGYGLVFRLAAGYHVTDRWTLDFCSDIQDWETNAGIDRTFFSNGLTMETRLNEVNWQSKAFMFGSTYKF